MLSIRCPLRAIVLSVLLALSVVPANADFSNSQQWFNELSEENRSLLQSQLMLLGHYKAMADGDFGNFTYSAIRAFQTSIGAAPTGVLTPQQYGTLEDTASGVFHGLGFDIVEDSRGMMVLLLPRQLLPSTRETRRGTSYAASDGSISLETIRKPFSEETYESLYQTLSSSPGSIVTYRVLNAERFVVSGSRGGKLFYMLINSTPGESVGFSLEWEPARNEVGAVVATFMASYSYPLAFAPPPVSQAASPKSPSTTPKNEGLGPPSEETSSGTGFFVAENGVLVTNHHVIEGCSAIHVAGYGPARLVTSDEDVDLAVLQLTTPKVHPVARIRTDPLELGEDVVALGFPLASFLNSSLNVGTGIVSSETGLMGEPRWFTTSVSLQPGNSGGPILDGQGSVVGVAVAKINDEALLAAIGTTAPNVGFAIKGNILAEYLSIFRLPEPVELDSGHKSARQLVEEGRDFTVQIVCSYSPSARAPESTTTPAPATAGLSLDLPSGYRWIVFASAKDRANLPIIDHVISPHKTMLALSDNGNYALIAGPFLEATAKDLLESWSSNPAIPYDTYLSSGRRFLHVVEGR